MRVRILVVSEQSKHVLVHFSSGLFLPPLFSVASASGRREGTFVCDKTQFVRGKRATNGSRGALERVGRLIAPARLHSILGRTACNLLSSILCAKYNRKPARNRLPRERGPAESYELRLAPGSITNAFCCLMYLNMQCNRECSDCTLAGEAFWPVGHGASNSHNEYLIN